MDDLAKEKADYRDRLIDLALLDLQLAIGAIYAESYPLAVKCIEDAMKNLRIVMQHKETRG